MLGLDGKDQIEAYGMEPFIQHCKDSVWKYKGMWEEFSDAVGFWADMEHPYVTYDNNYIESEWWALKQIWDKKLLYKGYKIVPYCPRCGTPLSSHEVAQGYKDVKERSAIARFKVKGEDAYILAMPISISSIVCNGSFLFLEKSFPGTFTHASKFAAVFFIAWNNADRTRSGYDFLFTWKASLKNVIIFKAKPSIFIDLSSVFCEKYCFYMSPCAEIKTLNHHHK